MKKTLKLIPAIAMLLISAVLVSTSTYAWFSMNTQVTATGMNVKASAEGGIVISNESGADWKASATASHGDVAQIIPTSTFNATNWYHNKSDNANDAKADQIATSYSPLTTTVANGIGFVDSDTDGELDSEENAYYLLNKFYIKSSADSINPATLKINKVTATGASTSALLDASLRVAIVLGGQCYIYAPVTSATLSYNVGGYTLIDSSAPDAPGNRNFAHAVTAVDCSTNGIVNTVATGVTNIPNNTANIGGTSGKPAAVEASIYIYFEGEDPNCKSANITTTLDALQVEVVFGTNDMTP